MYHLMIRFDFTAQVVKLVDTRDLKSLEGNFVPVQVRPRHKNKLKKMELKFKEKITKKIIFVTFIAMIFAFIFALSSFFFKPRFKTEILLEPVKIESLGSQLSYNWWAREHRAARGFDLSSLGGDDRELSEVAQANLLSRDFFKEHL